MPLGSKVCWVSNGQVWLCVPDVLVNAVPVYVIDISSHCRSNRDELPSFLNTEYSQVQILGAIQVLGNTMGGGVVYGSTLLVRDVKCPEKTS